MTVCFYPFKHSLWQMAGEMYSPQLWGSASPQTKAAQVTGVIHPLCSERQDPALFWVSSWEKKLPVMIPAASSFSVCVHHMTVSLSSSTTDEGFWSSQGRAGAGCSASGTWSSCADDGTEFSETEPFFTYPGRLRWPLTGTGPSLVVRWRDSGPLAVTLVTLVCDTIGP